MTHIPALVLLAALSGCANTHEDPYCLVYDSGKPVAFGFKASKAQRAMFERRPFFNKQANNAHRMVSPAGGK